MTKKQNKIFIIVGLVVSILLVFGIFTMNRNHKLEMEEQIALEMEERAKEERRLEKIEAEKKKEKEKQKAEETAKLREQFRKDAEQNQATGQGDNLATNSNNTTGKVPAPEVKQGTDKNGNKITSTQVPKINPSSVPDEVEKPSKKEPAPTAPPKEDSNATVTKPPASVKDEGTNNSTYPNTKPSEENKGNSTGKNDNAGGTYNPFTDPNRPETKANSSKSEDLGRPGEPQAGEGDKF